MTDGPSDKTVVENMSKFVRNHVQVVPLAHWPTFTSTPLKAIVSE